MLEQLKKKRYLGAAGLILLFLGTILPYYQYSFLGYSIKLSLYKYLEGKIVIVLIVANLLFIFKDLVEKYVPQMFNSNMGIRIKNANPKLAIVPTILIAVFVIILFLRVDLGTALKHGLGFFSLWLGVICLVLHSFLYKNSNETTNYSNQVNYNQMPVNSDVTISNNQQMINNNMNSSIRYCPGCSNGLSGNEQFCSNCGTNIEQIRAQESISNFNTSEVFANTSKNSRSFILEKIKSFIGKFRKQILIGISCLIIAIVGLCLYSKFMGFEKLTWDDSYLDPKTEYVTQTRLKLGVKFSAINKADEIKYETNCGEIKGKGLEITWNLLDVTGKCEISVSYKLKKIKKEIRVIPLDFKEKELSLEYNVDEDSDEDLDFDGLTNKQEKEYKTNPLVADSDLDGLDDYYEIFTSKTDPNKKDSDNDGLSDYDEIQLGLDPNKADSKNDGLKDGQRTLTYNYSSENLELSIIGKGNIASTISEVNTNTKISGKTGLIDNLYTLYTDGTIEKAKLTISYTDEELEKYDLNEDNLAIYYYNEKESKYEKVNSKIDKEKKTVTAELKHFSNYVVGDSSKLKENTSNQVLFVLDNSWSMYTNEQYKEYTGKDYSGGFFDLNTLDGTDADGLRFTLTSNLVTRFSAKNFQIGLSEFRSDYAKAFSIGSDAEQIKEKLTKMTGNFITNEEGTDIGNALIKGISEFTEDSDNKYIIILTDGQDYYLKSKTKSIITKAISNNVKICSIGFGEGSSNEELFNISNGTGCKFYSSSNALGLTELFENVGTELDDNLVDINGDNEMDGILMADSGFIVNRDGFSFSNYGTNLSRGGHCYGMAIFAQLYYKKLLPLNVGAKIADKDTSYPYNLTNTYFKNYANLYDYKLKTNSLKYAFGFDNFGEEQPADFRELKGTNLALNDKYKEEMIDSGIYDIVEEKTGLSKEEQLEKWGVNYETAENYYINEDKMQKNNTLNYDDKQMFNAIYAGFIKQNVTTYYASASNFILWLRNVVGTEVTEYKGANGFINILKTRLDDKDAPVIFASFSGGLHAINAISLVQDIDNPNYYYIGVYDNNYPGEKRYVDVECNRKKCVTKANDYYTKSGEPIRITPSLEYDLEYYK